jgi:hypothetical protein
MKKKIARIGLAGLMAASILGGSAALASAPALASGGGGGIEVAGQCTAASASKLKAKPDNGQLEVQFEVDSNVVGQTWGVILRDNGTTFFKGTATTAGTSGSFEVRKLTADQAGSDKIQAAAKNPKTGEICFASLSI